MLSSDAKTQLHAWIEDRDHGKILNFVELLIEQRDRAEFQTRAHLHLIKTLKERTDAVLKPLLEGKPPGAKPPAKPKSEASLGISLKL
jgi:hypothetical protein